MTLVKVATANNGALPAPADFGKLLESLGSIQGGHIAE